LTGRSSIPETPVLCVGAERTGDAANQNFEKQKYFSREIDRIPGNAFVGQISCEIVEV
jgi:hypothetical protein